MPAFLMRSLMGGFFFLCTLVSWAQTNDKCLADNEGVVWCAPQEGGLGQRPSGEVYCGVGKCIKMTNGAVVCSSQLGGFSALNYIGQAVCAGSCVAGKQALCVKPKP